ncbi:AraC family transcriptional regulator [Elizabethkingia anophelis]|uniref:helix-turn-helix domain-containing protein n=1 Tax=Elizabethkingia anophelis TaxID=1117645 RepID=UPI000B34F3E5|nr:helix-turn-helix transcriptional regulator [Elizabethkingia anophelis]MCT3698296.1 helix-turn-helix transcriptional regulator [Elizabethkingia anophelis]MCT3900215.1 helix-turn-helix transcriptional regulator [Elizabethkingia anophelis]MCT4328089.1 helix-turn-helix transcriptional regulator [Elizabethkingia anophelis]MDV3548313.1 AraC family transcriptional regulator [Elizabethkingia anophelis]MDV3564157.1 AraC family transcriptional regulator [Elizabethkingia anophelis]
MKTPVKVSSISAMHQFLGLKKPANPLISVFNFDEVKLEPETILSAVTTDFYVVALKKDCAGGKCKYGQQYYDFDDGIMYFIAPHQVLQFEDVLLNSVRGFVLVVHQDFLHGYVLASQIREYGYFSYTANEALHLSEKEEKSIMDIIHNIEQEIDANMDSFTQDLLVSNLDLLLKYCDRFYNRQFLTRKKANNDLLSKLEALLDDYFKNDRQIVNGIPTVHFIAEQLHLSANYLSDMLRLQTGQTTQQHIQNRLIEKAKELLSATEMSVSEIAYHLGFEHPQSFHRLFKNRTSVSPLEFRASFN